MLSKQPTPQESNEGAFWFTLINEKDAAEFVGLKPTTLRIKRQRGDGPKFVRISSRCIRYRRDDLKAWADNRIKANTGEYEAE